MRVELVALDLETTGLDIANDSIIEVGAVRLRDGQIVDEFESLVNPGFVIPSETTHITGIHQDDLRNAPALTQVLPRIEAFVGDAPVIAHNVSFDMGFMQRFGILKNNLAIDTFELASILMPREPRYSLSSLAQRLDIDLENAHRALDDARATMRLYWHLWEKALALPAPLLYEINRAMTPFEWHSGTMFKAAYAQVQSSDDAQNLQPVTEIFAPLPDDVRPLKADPATQPVELQEIDTVLGEEGSITSQIGAYENRPQQLEMAHQIADALNKGQHLMVEAGTGTGKSLAYLTPAALFALKNNQRVLVSTNTINLQDQLLHQDAPLLTGALPDRDLKIAVMKGRGNYLCPRRLAAVRRRQPGNIDELKTMAKILVWLQESQTGDRGEITLRSGEYFVWSRLSAEDEDCALHRCQSQMDGTCPYYKARKQAEAAHIVIANHALLVSDAAAENSVLPPYQYLIADEAHQLEDAVTQGMSFRIDQISLLRNLSDLGDVNSGLLGDLMTSARRVLPDKHKLRLEGFIGDLGDAIKAAQGHVRLFFSTLEHFIGDSGSDNAYRIRLDSKRRNHSSFVPVQDAWDKLDSFFLAISEAMRDLAEAIIKLEKYEIPGFEDHLNATSAAGRRLNDIHVELDALVRHPDENRVYWINNANNTQYMGLQSAPLHVGPLMEEHLWHNKRSVILTSATLRTAGTFDFLRERLYADDVKDVALGSPFDYQQSTLVYVPDDIPMPNENGYQRYVERGLVELATALNGRVLALFTSYAQLRETAANISPRLSLGNITVYDQATGGSREALLDSFKTTERSVLLGTRSFWEGVDIPGDDLVALVIVRLPFSVPNDPIFAARSATYRDSFNDYAVPDAILRFRQGFGRLIRTRTDRGIVAIFDSRVIHKSYGMKFLESLPDVTLQYGDLAQLPQTAVNWLSRDT